MRWYIPTFYGDIKVEATGPKACSVIVAEATPQEQTALGLLRVEAKRKGWLYLESDDFSAVTTHLQAPVEVVAKVLAKILKPGKKLVSAVKFANGRMEEVTAATFKTAPSFPRSTADSRSDHAAVSASEAAVSASEAAATTVAAPTRGCPPPDFSPARLRAREVLCAFLTPEQREDFERHNRFIAFGGTTGTRYMITSRTARDQLRTFQRTLYDLDRNLPLCVHDWDVPPEEEMHALNVLIQLPGYEHYLRHLEG